MKKELSQFLAAYIEDINSRNKALDEEEKKLTIRLENIKKERTQLLERQSRAINYPQDFGGRTICRMCYLEHGLSVELKPIPSDDETDKFKCRHCGHLLEVEV